MIMLKNEDMMLVVIIFLVFHHCCRVCRDADSSPLAPCSILKVAHWKQNEN